MAFLTARAAHLVGMAGLGAVLLGAGNAHAQTEPTIENEVKAAFLYNFGKYVEWPAPPPGGDDAGPFRICALADASFIRNLDAIVAGETIDGRSVERQTPDTVDAARGCRILFIARSELERAQRLLSAVHGAPVLTVSDAPDFLARGGAIAFIRDGSRVRFDVNVAEAQRGGLTISSRLLRVARRVSTLQPDTHD